MSRGYGEAMERCLLFCRHSLGPFSLSHRERERNTYPGKHPSGGI
jgi:hypothetical protein